MYSHDCYCSVKDMFLRGGGVEEVLSQNSLPKNSIKALKIHYKNVSNGENNFGITMR